MVVEKELEAFLPTPDRGLTASQAFQREFGKSTSTVSNIFSMANTFKLCLLLFPHYLSSHRPRKCECLLITRASSAQNLKTSPPSSAQISLC